MRRPAAVIVTCIILGFTAFSLLVSAAFSLFFIAIAGNFPLPAQPGQPAPDPAMMASMLHGTMIVMALVETALAAWAIATLVGLARMKNWARYSVIVIGGGLALIGLFGVVGMIFAQTLLTSGAMPAIPDPVHFRIVMVIGGFFYLAIAGIGIWWLVYFAKRSTREAFALAATPQTPPPIGYAPPPSPYAASTYEVAAYIPTSNPGAAPIVAPTPIPAQVIPTPPTRPLAISIIAWLLIAGAAFCLPFAFLPFPLFFFGTVVSGWPAHLTIICFGVISGLAGIGLLRLEKIALYAACAFYGFGILNSSLILLPSVRERMIAYEADLIQKMSMGMPMTPMFDSHKMGLMMIPGIFFGILFCVALIALLIHYRAAFDRPLPSR
jgi:hypothetical protein